MTTIGSRETINRGIPSRSTEKYELGRILREQVLFPEVRGKSIGILNERIDNELYMSIRAGGGT